jgi:hypothetical protein
MSTIRIVQYFDLLAFTSEKAARRFAAADDSDTITAGGNPGEVRHRYQNYFVNQQKRRCNRRFDFVPFRSEGTVSNIGGDNNLVQILFPNVEIGIRMVEQGNGNRLSRLTLDHCLVE